MSKREMIARVAGLQEHLERCLTLSHKEVDMKGRELHRHIEWFFHAKYPRACDPPTEETFKREIKGTWMELETPRERTQRFARNLLNLMRKLDLEDKPSKEMEKQVYIYLDCVL
jgi:hypothetical protein